MKSYKKIQANVDSSLALQAEGIFQDIGLNTTTAINVFLKKVVATGGIPFELKETPEQKASRELIQSISKIPHKEAKTKKEKIGRASCREREKMKREKNVKQTQKKYINTTFNYS